MGKWNVWRSVKKCGAQDSVDFRTVILVSHASKIVVEDFKPQVIRLCLTIAESYLGKDQFRFRKSRGTRDVIGALRVLYERNLVYNNEVYVCKVDYEKAYDRVDWSKLLTILQT